MIPSNPYSLIMLLTFPCSFQTHISLFYMLQFMNLKFIVRNKLKGEVSKRNNNKLKGRDINLNFGCMHGGGDTLGALKAFSPILY